MILHRNEAVRELFHCALLSKQLSFASHKNKIFGEINLMQHYYGDCLNMLFRFSRAKTYQIGLGFFWAQRTELQKYLDAKRCIQEENPQNFFKTDRGIAQLREISSGFRSAFIKYDGGSTPVALSFAISDLFGCCQSWVLCYQQNHKLTVILDLDLWFAFFFNNNQQQ